MALRIRDIERRDIEVVVAMCRAMSDESPFYRERTFSEKKVRELITQIVTSWARPLFGKIVETEDGKPVGMIGAQIQEYFMSEEIFSTDFGIYLAPEYRNGSIFPRMVKQYEEWALSKGVHLEDIHLGISTGVAPERTVCLYERLGYKLMSYNMVKKGTGKNV